MRRNATDLLVMGTIGRTGVRKFLLGSVAEEAMRESRIYEGLAVLSNVTVAVAVAVGMWKPASFAGFQAPRASRTVVADVPSFRLGAPFPQLVPGLSAILARMCCLGGRRSGNSCISESRVECTFFQILVQSRKATLRKKLDFDRSSMRLISPRTPLVRHLMARVRLRELVPQRVDLAATPDIIVEMGSSADVILKAADDTASDLIVIGACGAGALARLASHFGSVAHKIVCRAVCPVLTVRPLTDRDKER